jgi:hypothetical protein
MIWRIEINEHEYVTAIEVFAESRDQAALMAAKTVEGATWQTDPLPGVDGGYVARTSGGKFIFRLDVFMNE